MPRKISEKKIKEIIDSFINGNTIDELSKAFNCTKITISRHLKKNISLEKYNIICQTNTKRKNKATNFKEDLNPEIISNNEIASTQHQDKEFICQSFVEISPLDCEIDNLPQKDLSSIPIAEINFPKLVFLIVDQNIELVTKLLNDYPTWNFLSEDELKRKTIEIFVDRKIAKSFCNKEQRVIKVPNTNVFKIVAPYLISRGITRIVSSDTLIAL